MRVNPTSPYGIAARDGALRLSLDGREVADVELPPMPEYYRHTLANGKTVMETAPTIQWGYLIYLTVLRLCQYFGAKEECQFCDINHNWRQHKRKDARTRGSSRWRTCSRRSRSSTATTREGEPRVHAHRRLGDFRGGQPRGGGLLRPLRAGDRGTLPGSLDRQGRRPGAPKKDVQRYKDYGIAIYHPNYEVWDKRLFSIICPGKERYVGREEWHRRIFDAGDVFGPRNVIPNFVAGVEMAKPFGFESIDEAIASTTEGLDHFMSRGITPRFTTWCPEPTTPLGRDNPGGAPLEYHVRLLGAYREALHRHSLDPPPGYGEAGTGRAVFSVSSFMDVL